MEPFWILRDPSQSPLRAGCSWQGVSVRLLLVKAHEIDVETSAGRVSGVACCFCGDGVEATRIDPVTIDLTANDEHVSQVFWAHARCLVAARISDLRGEFYDE